MSHIRRRLTELIADNLDHPEAAADAVLDDPELHVYSYEAHYYEGGRKEGRAEVVDAVRALAEGKDAVLIDGLNRVLDRFEQKGATDG